MNVSNKEEWRDLAAKVMPLLPKYVASLNTTWDAEAAQALYEADDNKTLAKAFDSLWGRLPDNPAIRVAPFFDLCTLCSEQWTCLYVKEDEKAVD